MLRKILETIFSKGITAISNFVTVILTSAYLGAAVRGEIALLLLSVNIVNLFQVILGGPVIAFLVPNNSVRSIFSIAFIWNAGFGVLISLLLVALNLIDNDLIFFLINISILQGLISIFQNTLIGKKEITKQNILEIIRAVLVMGLISFYLIFQGITDVSYVYLAYVFANSAVVIVGFIFISPYLMEAIPTNSIKSLFRQMLRFGIQVQFNNISQIINYRFVYYLIEKWKGLEALGVFSVAVSIGEAAWVICRSIGTFQMSQLVNEKDSEKQRDFTILMAKLSISLTSLAVIALLLLPIDFYTYIFGDDFIELKSILFYFSGGILFLSFFTIFNHHYTATDRNIENIKSSLLGNIVSILAGLVCVHYLSIQGGALTYTIANLAMLSFLWIQFNKRHNTKFSDFIPKPSDFRIFSKH